MKTSTVVGVSTAGLPPMARWSLELSCGHRAWVFRKVPPKIRAEILCLKCRGKTHYLRRQGRRHADGTRT